MTLIHEDLQELINITRSRNDINVSQIVDSLKRELNLLDICCIDVVSILHFKSVYSSSNTYVNKILKSQMKSV
jgi:hypothetical protein